MPKKTSFCINSWKNNNQNNLVFANLFDAILLELPIWTFNSYLSLLLISTSTKGAAFWISSANLSLELLFQGLRIRRNQSFQILTLHLSN